MTQHRQIADWLCDARSAIVLTGAGISTESGIPDFRSPGGVWSKYRTVYYDEFLSDPAARCEYWRQKAEQHDDFAAAQPNAAHLALARWEAAGRMLAVITQNIDGLHQLAGSRQVLELHGTAREVSCVKCRWRHAVGRYVGEFRRTGQTPTCPECGGWLKHATISFGQSLPEETLARAREFCVGADLCFAIGSSLQVMPAAALPALARNRGARLVIVNRDPTPLDGLADVVLRGSIGAELQEIDRLLTSESLA